MTSYSYTQSDMASPKLKSYALDIYIFRKRYISKYRVSSKKTVYIIISLESFVDKCYEKFDVGGSVCKGINDGERCMQS